ncbi:hypothetical protein JOE51_006313 [Bradyrhizobium japonicum]|nr:hypothetical protein [Bradyrhizobium japonicum]
MKIFSCNGQPLPSGVPFELDGQAYPWNWFDLASVEDLAERGITVQEVPDVLPVPASISDRQFFQQLAINGTISRDDALAAVKVGTIPAPLQAIVNAIQDAEQRFAANMLLSGATVFERAHPLTAAIGAAQGMTSDQVDIFFRAAAQV